MPAPPIRQLTNSVSGDMDWRDEVEFLASEKRDTFLLSTAHEGTNFVIKAGSSMDVDGTLVTFSADENYATGQPRLITNHGFTDINSIDANGSTVLIAGTGTGMGGVLKRSTDRGLNWSTVLTTANNQTISRIRYLGGKWIVLTYAAYIGVGDNRSYIYTSDDDGVNWSGQLFQAAGSTDWLGVAYNGSNLYVAVGGYTGTTNYNYITSSADGITWAAPYHVTAPQAALGLYDIDYGNGIFICEGRCRGIFRSANANPTAAGSWTSCTFTNAGGAYYLRYVGYVYNGSTHTWLVGAETEGMTWYSTNGGVSWTGPSEVPTGAFGGITNIRRLNNTIYVPANKAQGEYDFLWSSTAPTNSVSSFTSRDTFSDLRIMQLAWDGTYYYLANDAGVIIVLSSFPTKNRAYATDGTTKTNSVIATPVYDGKKKGYYVAGSSKRIYSFYKGWGKIQIKNKKMGAQT